MSRRAAAIVGLVVAFGATAAVAVALWPDRDIGADATVASTATGRAPELGGGADPGGRGRTRTDGLMPQGTLGAAPATTAADPDPVAEAGSDSRFGLETVPLDPPVEVRIKQPPAAGVLFDVDSGEVLWARHATVSRPIASLTKMMTALIVAEGDDPSERVLITPKAAHAPGSATGILPPGKEVPLEPLLQALIMISANDAAVALAEHDGGTLDGFIKAMNQRAALMGLDCSHFTTPNGLRDRGNYSCPLDLAALARADLANNRIARIAETRAARPAFPIKGGKLHLANNHYFLIRGLAGVPGSEVTGLKTGFTDAAGRCYVTTARVGSTNLGVVLLGSPDPFRQVPQLLRAGFVATGDLTPPAGAGRRSAGR